MYTSSPRSIILTYLLSDSRAKSPLRQCSYEVSVVLLAKIILASDASVPPQNNPKTFPFKLGSDFAIPRGSP